MKTAKEMLESTAEFARKMFEDTGSLQPMWILENKTEVVPIVAPFTTEGSKDMAVAFVRKKAREMKADVSGFIAEAWMVSLNKDQKLDVMPSAHQDRREIIQVYAEDKSGARLAGMYFILRPERGKATLSPFKTYMDAGTTTGGRFTSILENA